MVSTIQQVEQILLHVPHVMHCVLDVMDRRIRIVCFAQREILCSLQPKHRKPVPQAVPLFTMKNLIQERVMNASLIVEHVLIVHKKVAYHAEALLLQLQIRYCLANVNALQAT